jgi:hypothetical protein
LEQDHVEPKVNVCKRPLVINDYSVFDFILPTPTRVLSIILHALIIEVTQTPYKNNSVQLRAFL